MGTIVDAKDPILVGWAKGDMFAAESLADAPSPVLEVDEAVAADLANLVARRVLDRRQSVGEGPRPRRRPAIWGKRGKKGKFTAWRLGTM